MDGWILVGIGVVSLLCFLVGIWANWILGRADSDDTGRPDDYYTVRALAERTKAIHEAYMQTLQGYPQPVSPYSSMQSGSQPIPSGLALGYAIQPTTIQATHAAQQALAVQLAHTTPTSQWNGANYGHTYTTSDGVADRIQEAMRAWGCTHWLSCTRSITKYATEVHHDDHQYDIYDVDADTKLAECLAWLQSVCTGSNEFWGWHEAWGTWDESEQLHADYLE